MAHEYTPKHFLRQASNGQLKEEATTKPADQTDAKAPASRPAGRLGGRLGWMDGAPGDQKAIVEWVKQATTAFWDASLKKDAQARKFLESDILDRASGGKAKLERR